MQQSNKKKYILFRILIQVGLLSALLVSLAIAIFAIILRRNVTGYIVSYVIMMLVCAVCIYVIQKATATDSLTGISNKEAFTFTMVRMWKQKKLPDYAAAFLNISGMKYLNQVVGSDGGDQLLKNYAQTIEKFLGGHRYFARLGGDNFILLVRKEKAQELLDLLNRMKVKVEQGEETRELYVSSRVGLHSLTERDAVSDVFNSTSIALSYVKKDEPIWYKWYEDYMTSATIRKKKISFQFSEALRGGEFVVYYQPKVNAKEGVLSGCEALVRWKKGEDLIAPMDFIPVLEQEGKIMELDFFVFEQACKDLRHWQEMGWNPVPISTNFSRLHLRDAYFVENVLEIISCYRIDKSLIEIELTESASEQDYDALKFFLTRMGESGIKVSMDDFGVGFSSLELLKNPGFQTVKIDKRFVDNIDKADGINPHAKLLENIIKTCHSMNKKIIAEGVECEAQRDLLVQMGCPEQQGYLYDRPVPKEQFEEWLRHPDYIEGSGK